MTDKRKDDLGHLPALLIVAAAALLLLARLGGVVFWGDEAETAVLARNTLDYWTPIAWDGKNLVESLGLGFNDRLIWNQQPWLQLYLAAGSFAVFDEDTAAARLPFALAGLVAVILTYVLVEKETGSRAQALLAMGLLAANVQFLLFARQCRYYALLSLGVVLALLAWRKIERVPGAVAFAFACAIIFHSNYLAFFPTLAAFWLYALIFRRERPILLDLALATVICAILTLPWVFYADAWGASGQMPDQTLSYWLFKVKTYASKVSRRIVPFSFLLGLLALYLRGNVPEKRLVRLAALILVGTVLFVPFAAPALVLRYGTGLFPLGAILAASFIAGLWRWRKPAAVAVAVLFVATQLGNTVDILATHGAKVIAGGKRELDNRWIREDPGTWFLRTEYADFARELVHGFPQNPNRLIIDFVRKHVERGELVASGHDWLPLIFYTDARVMGAWESPAHVRVLKDSIQGYTREPWDEEVFWYVERKGYWEGLLAEIVRRADEGEYSVEKFETSIPDIPHGNDPDLDSRIREDFGRFGTIDIYRVEKVPGRSGTVPADP